MGGSGSSGYRRAGGSRVSPTGMIALGVSMLVALGVVLLLEKARDFRIKAGQRRDDDGASRSP